MSVVGGYIVLSQHNNTIGLGMWPTSEDKAILKARRKKSSSKGKSSLPQKSPASLERESVADCYDSTSHMKSMSSKDPAMVKAVEKPPATVRTGVHGVQKQRTEARSHRRNYVPVKKGKAHVTLKDSSLSDAGDSSREKGGTQKFLTVYS